MTLSSSCTVKPAQPLVSVIIPAYNAAEFLERTLNSVLAQQYTNFEVLLIDDGSTDETDAIAKSFAARDRRIRLYHQANAGVAIARNRGIDHALGDFIAPLDADDLWEASYLCKQVQALVAADETVAMTYAWSVDIDANDCLTGGVRISPYYGNIYPALLYQNVIGNASACLIKRRCLRELGAYNPEFLAQQAQGCEDWDLYLRLAAKYPVVVVPELLVGYRQAPGSMSTQTEAMAKSRALTFQAIREQHPAVYAKVRQWSASAAHLYTARQCLKMGQPCQAWRAFYQALLSDWLITLTTYTSYTLLIQLCAMTLNQLRLATLKPAPPPCPSAEIVGHSQTPSGPLAEALPGLDSARPASLPPVTPLRASKRSQLKLYIRLLLTPLFPCWLVRRIRMDWVTSQVCAERPAPDTMPFWRLNLTSLDVQVRSRQPNCRIDFSQSPANPASSPRSINDPAILPSPTAIKVHALPCKPKNS